MIADGREECQLGTRSRFGAPQVPMNIKSHFPDFPMWAGAQADIDRIEIIWNESWPVLAALPLR